jgi:hypothetical protein
MGADRESRRTPYIRRFKNPLQFSPPFFSLLEGAGARMSLKVTSVIKVVSRHLGKEIKNIYSAIPGFEQKSTSSK